MSMKRFIQDRNHLQKTIREDKKPSYGDLLTIIRTLNYLLTEAYTEQLSRAKSDDDKAAIQGKTENSKEIALFAGKWAR